MSDRKQNILCYSGHTKHVTSCSTPQHCYVTLPCSLMLWLYTDSKQPCAWHMKLCVVQLQCTSSCCSPPVSCLSRLLQVHKSQVLHLLKVSYRTWYLCVAYLKFSYLSECLIKAVHATDTRVCIYICFAV